MLNNIFSENFSPPLMLLCLLWISKEVYNLLSSNLMYHIMIHGVKIVFYGAYIWKYLSKK